MSHVTEPQRRPPCPLPRRAVPRASAALVLVGALGGALPGAARAQGTVAWTAPTRGVSVAVDAAEAVLTVDYEQQLGSECEVTKRDAQGNLLWSARIDQTDPTKWERAQWIAVAPDGAAVVCATLMSGFANPVVAASVVLKFDAHGAPLWRVVYENGFDGTSTRKCLVDAAGAIYVLGTGVGATGATTKIKKLAPDGTTLWTYLDGAGIGVPTNFKFAGDGHLVVASRALLGSLNGYARIDRDTGAALWSLAGIASPTPGDAAGDAAGETYLVHGEPVANGGTVLRKLGPTGAPRWTRVHPSSGSRIELGPDARPVIAGLPSTTAAGAAFFKVDGAGDLVWANLDADGPLSLLLHAQLVLDGAGNAYLAAGLLGSMAVCAVHNDGAAAWTTTMPGGSGAHGLALGEASGSVFVVGGTTVRLDDPRDLGASYCGPAQPNSTGRPARIGARGSALVARNDVLLVAQDLPPNAAAYFLTSRSQGFVAHPGGSQGDLCLGGAIGRYSGPGQVRNSGLLGRVQLRLDLAAMPTPTGPAAVLAGSTWSFQCWHRDLNPAPTSNFTDGLQLPFL